MAILEHKLSASSIVWVVNITAPFLSLTPFYMAFQRNLLAIGSTPEEGSSKNYIFVPPINANATHNFLLFPPLSLSAAVNS